MMFKVKLFRKDGRQVAAVSDDVSELLVTEPVSDLANLAEVIERLPNLQSLSLCVTDLGKSDSTETLEFLRGAKALRFLSLGSQGHLRDCAGLRHCKSLEWLRVFRYTSFDFSALSRVPSLRRLEVEMPRKSALGKIAKATQLTSLEVRGGFRLDSLEPLSTLRNLRKLRLWSGALTSTQGLSSLSEIELLDLGYSKLKDTTELGDVPTLRRLELIGNKSISSLEFLRDGNLESLGLFEIPKLDSIKPIARLSRLEEFKCSAHILDNDLQPLLQVSTLKHAQLPGRYKQAIKGLRGHSSCAFRVGGETIRLTKNGPVVLETAAQANQRLRRKLGL